ncbi:hypothetical protein LUZ60_000824 [Juncus effusus]|nr:hypothetical protein LUZ60_000824 [Juncus effusus]
MRSDSREEFVVAKKTPWSLTFITQAVLCFFLFVAFNIGQSQTQVKVPLSNGEDLRLVTKDSDDYYFISVTGGSRPLELQSRLLKQMEKTTKIYKPKFVLNIGEIGEDDPLLNNATFHIELLKIPWYATTASKGRVVIGNFMKKFKLPFNQVLEIIGVDTGLLQDFAHLEKNSTNFKEQMDWLQKVLTYTSSDWRIVVGFDPLAICNEDSNNKKNKKLMDVFHDIFATYGVDAYISTKGCLGYSGDEHVVYLGAPSPKDENKIYLSPSDVQNGFLLHRINGLVMETYLVDSEGRTVLESGFTQRERGSKSVLASSV